MQLSCLGGNSFAPVFGGLLYTVSTNLVNSDFNLRLRTMGRDYLNYLRSSLYLLIYLFICNTTSAQRLSINIQS